MYVDLHTKYPLSMPDVFPDRVTKSCQTLNFNRILSVGTEMFHTDGRTDG